MSSSNGDAKPAMGFVAKVAGVKINTPKSKGYSTPSAATIDVTFRVAAPQPPDRPRKPWNMDRVKQELAGFGGVEPTDKKKKETFNRLTTELAAFDAEWRREQARYEREQAAIGPQTMAFAQIVGLMAVFGDKRLEITVRPADQDMLPGLELLAMPMLAPPAPDEEDDEDLDDDGFDEEDLEDETEELAPA